MEKKRKVELDTSNTMPAIMPEENLSKKEAVVMQVTLRPHLIATQTAMVLTFNESLFVDNTCHVNTLSFMTLYYVYTFLVYYTLSIQVNYTVVPIN